MLITDFDPRAIAVLDQLTQAGYKAWLVGGCVRDKVLGRPLHDYDATTNATPDDVVRICSRFHCLPTGIQHGTVTVIHDDLPVEVTTHRRDGLYLDGRHPENVTFSSRLEDDLERRDFTINAMAWNPRDGLTDPLGGRLDIEAKIIRAVGDPSRRFSEDALRILRAIRLSAELGFDIEPATLEAMNRLSARLRHISVERVTTEFARMLLADRPIWSLCLPVWRTVFPELDLSISAWTKLGSSAVDAADPWSGWRELPMDLACRFAAFFARVQLSETSLSAASGLMERCLRHTRFSNRQVNDIRAIAQTLRSLEALSGPSAKRTEVGGSHSSDCAARSHPPVLTVRRLIARHGIEAYIFAMSVLRFMLRDDRPRSMVPEFLVLRDYSSLYNLLMDATPTVLASPLPTSIRGLAVNGRLLQERLKLRPGPWLGRVLDQLLDAVMAEQLPNEEEALLKAAQDLTGTSASR